MKSQSVVIRKEATLFFLRECLCIFLEGWDSHKTSDSVAST